MAGSMNTKLTASFDCIIAERTFEFRDGRSGVVKICIAQPQRIKDEENWICEFKVEGIDIGNAHYACGVDSLQALTCAIERIELLMRPFINTLQWFQGIDHLGLCAMVPLYYGRSFHDDIVSVIDRKVKEKK